MLVGAGCPDLLVGSPSAGCVPCGALQQSHTAADCLGWAHLQSTELGMNLSDALHNGVSQVKSIQYSTTHRLRGQAGQYRDDAEGNVGRLLHDIVVACNKE